MVNESEVFERLQQKCRLKFREDLSLADCYELLKRTIDLETSGAENCFAESPPLIEHNIAYNSFCGMFDNYVTRYLMPILIVLCYSNVLTLLIYKLPYFDGSSSINFLRVKAIANFIFVHSRIFEFIHAWTSEPNETFEVYFWASKPFIITVANISGSISTWLTLLVTFETALCVLMPFSFRQFCTRKKTSIALFSCILTSICLHTTFFLIHTVKPVVSIKWLNGQQEMFVKPLNSSIASDFGTRECWYLFKFYTIKLSETPFYQLLEKLYYWAQAILSISLPTFLMLICTIIVVSKFTFKELNNSLSQRRRCVIRLTISTTVSHLLLEGPAFLTFIAAARKGAETDQHDTIICVFNHVNNLLSIINATIPFFVFILCNQQFRSMSAIYLKIQTEARHEKRATLLAVALNERSKAGNSQTERSFADQLLIGKISNL